MRNEVGYFAVATLAPVPFLVLGAAMGGVWIFLALIYMTILALALDELLDLSPQPVEDAAEFPGADLLSALLAILHFPLLLLAIWAVSGASGLGFAERVAAFFAFGLYFGQVSNSNAHELIHRRQRLLFTLGKWVFITLFFGHHTSAHRLVHHVHVATDADPNSARPGESFYRFAPRAWLGSFIAGLRAENRSLHSTIHPYVEYLAGAALTLEAAALIGGRPGVFAALGLGAYATLQLLLSDYVQHYGLRRKALADGTHEPVRDHHSWNAPHWFTGLLMLNAARHSDHHIHAARPYPRLEYPGDAPTLPYSLPIMGAIALWPARFRRVMKRKMPAPDV